MSSLEALIKMMSRTCLIFLFLNSATSFAQQDTRTTVLVGGSKEAIYDATVIDTEIVFTVLFNKVLEDTNEKFKIKIFDTDDELAEMVKEGKVDAIFSNILKINLLRKYLNFNATYAVQIGPVLRSRYYLLVQKDSGITSVQQLRNKKINIPNGHAAGELFLDVLLLQQNLPVKETFFAQIKHSKESNSAVVNLFFNKADAALVTDFTFDMAKELNPQVGKKLEILSSSDPMVNIVVAYHKDFPQSRIDDFEPNIWNMHKRPEVLQIMERFRYQGLKRLSERDIKKIQLMSEEYLKLTTNNKQ